MSSRTFLKPKSPLRAKFWIVKHFVSSDRPDWKAIEDIAFVDREFYLICRAFTRYKNAETLISGFNDIELELSFKKFCPKVVLDNVFSGRQDISILEPTLPPNFIDNAIKRFLSLDDRDQMLSTLTMPLHTFLHRIWKKAACSEMRPNKQLSGKIVSTLCEEIVLQCRCSKNYLMDIFVFYNYTINKKMNVEIYYTKSMHKLAVRLIKISFVGIEPLYVRRSPRVLPLDILFDIGTFLTRNDLDVCQLVCKEWYQMIENNRNGFALHSLTSAKLVSKGDFFCFGVFDEDESTSNIVDFRERRCNFEVVGSLFYPLLRNSSVHKLYIKRIDMRIVFESFVKGISRCLPTHIRRLVFSAAQVDSMEKVFEFSEAILKIKEYEVEVFSEDLFRHILKQPIVHRCDRLVLYEQYHSNREVLFDVINFFSTFPRPSCTFVMRNVVSEDRVNDLLSTFIKDFQKSKTANPFSPMLLVLHHQPRDLPSCCVNAIKVNVPDAFVFETPTLSNVYHFENASANVITFCIGRTIYHPIRRICHIKFGVE